MGVNATGASFDAHSEAQANIIDESEDFVLFQDFLLGIRKCFRSSFSRLKMLMGSE